MRPFRSILPFAFIISVTACSQGASPDKPEALTPATQGGSPVHTQQIHAIPIGTAPPTVSTCTTAKSDCHAKERTDIPAIRNSAALLPAAIPGFHPVDLQGAYALPSLVSGSGSTIAIVVAYSDANAESDMNVYRTKFGLGACTVASKCLKIYNQGGVANHRGPSNSGWATETSIDLDMASAVCPKCTLELVEANDDSQQNLALAELEAVALKPAVISNSWSIPESAGMLYVPNAFVHPGTAVVAGSGDSGQGVSWPAAEPTVIAVGGTTLMRDGAVSRGWDEQAWASAGFGCSTIAARPAWQSPVHCGTHRGIADIAAVADPLTGVAIYDTAGDPGHGGTGGWEVYGGTSVATPIVAGAIALAPRTVNMSNASFIYQNASMLNPVLGGPFPMQAGLGSPHGTAAL